MRPIEKPASAAECSFPAKAPRWTQSCPNQGAGRWRGLRPADCRCCGRCCLRLTDSTCDLRRADFCHCCGWRCLRLTDSATCCLRTAACGSRIRRPAACGLRPTDSDGLTSATEAAGAACDSRIRPAACGLRLRTAAYDCGLRLRMLVAIILISQNPQSQPS